MAGNPLLNLAGRRPAPAPDDPTDLPPMRGGPGGPPPPPKKKAPPPGAGPDAGDEGPGEPEGAGDKEKMPTNPEEAITVLEYFGISPQDFPLIKAAVELISDAMDEQNQAPPPGGPPPGGPGGQPPAGPPPGP